MTPPDFDSIGKEDSVDFFHRVKPQLEKMEKVRAEKYESYIWRRKIGAWIATAVTPLTAWVDYNLLFIWSKSSDDSGAGLTFAVLGGLYAWVTAPKRAYAKAYKQEIMPDIAALFGLRFDVDGKIPMHAMQPTKIIPSHDRYTSEDYFEGEHKGAMVKFSEIHLEQRRRSKKRTYYVTVFKGMAIMIDLPKAKFYGHTVLTADSPDALEWVREKSIGLQRADLVDPEFEKKYSVFTNDQVEARYLIHPAMIERIVQIQHSHVSGGISASYHNKRILILIETKKNLFEPADITIPATDAEALSALRQEVSETLSLVDYFEFYKPVEKPAAVSSSNTEQIAPGAALIDPPEGSQF
jgi:hypothetical protein